MIGAGMLLISGKVLANRSLLIAMSDNPAVTLNLYLSPVCLCVGPRSYSRSTLARSERRGSSAEMVVITADILVTELQEI